MAEKKQNLESPVNKTSIHSDVRGESCSEQLSAASRQQCDSTALRQSEDDILVTAASEILSFLIAVDKATS